MKQTFLAALFSLFYLGLFSQISSYDFGIIGGGNAMASFQQQSYYFNMGWSAGTTVQFNFQKKFSIRTGIGYLSNHSKYDRVCDPNVDNSIPCYPSKAKHTMGWITVPVLAKWSFGKSSKFTIDIGPKLYATLWEKGETIYATDDRPDYSWKQFKLQEFYAYLSTGVGYQFPLNDQWHLHSEFRADWIVHSRSSTPLAGFLGQILVGGTYRLQKQE